MKLTEEQAAVDPEGVGRESPVESQRNEIGPSLLGPASKAELPKPCQDPFESSQPEAEASTMENGKETQEGGGPRSTVKT